MDENRKNQFFRRENIVTIPNAISLFRLLLIPVFSLLYMREQNYPAAIAVIALSGLSDIVDGKIARRFNMVSDFGKMLDPVVDKLTQAAMFFCLLSKFPHMLTPLIILSVKEIVTGIMSLVAFRKSSEVEGAKWPGKVTTALLYVAVLIHIIWPNISPALSDGIIAFCIVWMLFAFIFYGIRNIKTIRKNAKTSGKI